MYILNSACYLRIIKVPRSHQNALEAENVFQYLWSVRFVPPEPIL